MDAALAPVERAQHVWPSRRQRVDVDAELGKHRVSTRTEFQCAAFFHEGVPAEQELSDRDAQRAGQVVVTRPDDHSI